LFPELASGFDGVNAGIFPPGRFVAHTVHQAMMDATKRNREFVAGLATERARLHEPQVMRVGGFATANEAGLLGDVAKVLAVAIAPGRGNARLSFS
jgi:hypothetical protein